MQCYYACNRLHCSISITFICTKTKKLRESLYWIFASLLWSGTKPDISPRFACTWDYITILEKYTPNINYYYSRKWMLVVESVAADESIQLGDIGWEGIGPKMEVWGAYRFKRGRGMHRGTILE